MTNQKLFEALERVCGFTALEADMFEIIRAVEADKMPMTETIEQAAKRFSEEGSWQCPTSFKAGWKARDSQPNPHRITVAHVEELMHRLNLDEISYFRMVEILNEIAAGKHKERIEI